MTRFDLPGGSHAVFTTRIDGNLSSVGGDGAEHGLREREQLRERLGVRTLLRGYQVHGTNVQRTSVGDAREQATPAVVGSVAEIESGLDFGIVPEPNVLLDSVTQPGIEADGQATAEPGVGALVLTADCLPVALGAEGAVAMLHAGWRGLAAGVLEEGVRAVRELGGTGEMVAIIGPGAGPCCYEVGEEVHAALVGADRVDRSPRRKIDLKALARDRLLAAGVAEVRDVAACTICDERFFSHRREGARAGRQGGVAWLS